ncbi:MAG: bifunctional YncE family protein/alkaline phosphatase family protein [Candidatus Eremiobacteraeota bacterium]|nr:bifunctional YncE family protein/alkaline phosphatase family protein [Candidatus Eremiobacteraeota bacterium]
MSRFWSYCPIIVLAALCAAFSAGCPQSSSTVPPVVSSGESASSSNVLVNGRAITPAGTASGPVGGMPLNIALSPDGRYAVTTSSAISSLLCTLRVSDGTVVNSFSFPTMDANNPNNGLFYGLAFDPAPQSGTYTLYASQGVYGTVAVLTLGADGSLTQTGTIPSKPRPYMPDDQPAGLALAKGNLYLANYFPVDLAPPHPPKSSFSIYQTDGSFLGRYTFPGMAHTDTPCFPLAVTVKSDGTRAYVASQRDGCVYVLDTSDPKNPALASTITDLAHPSALLLNKAQTLLFIANAGSDTISVVDTASNQVAATVLLRPTNVSNLPGVSPTGLALSPDEKTLYASLGDFNAVAVIDTGTSQLSGYIPAGWYPTALAATPDNKGLLVVNGWGTTAMNPNPQFNYLDPDVVRINSSTNPPTWANQPGPGYVLDSIPGNVSRIDLTEALPALIQSTEQVIQNNQHTTAIGSNAGDTLARLGVKSGKIKHVIYVIKENRGYDQVLGDLPRGNGDPSLTLFGRQITPNQHALAERFTLLDNYYNNAPVSGEGWVWCTQSLANAFTIRAIPYIYRLQPATYNLNYQFEGQNSNYITGGYPAQDQDGNWLSTSHQASPPITNIAEAPGGYIWDKVREAGLTYRNYGFYLSTGVPSTGPPYQIPDNYPNVANLCPPGHIPTPPGQVAGYSDYDYRKFDFSYADSDAWVKHNLTASSIGLTTGSPPGYYHSPNSPTPAMPSRFSEWNREFQAMLAQDPTGGTVPTFMMVRFMRDHTMGTNPSFGSPKAMMADNDYAVGQLVEAVSKSPIWKSTVIFVIEDDAQFSPDHIDTHRSFCLVISPWIRKGTLDSNFYDTVSVLKSMELLLGLTPMSQYDALSNPITGGWDTTPGNSAQYDAILPPADIISEVNPTTASLDRKDPRRRLAIESSRMNWKVADAAPYRLLNEILWKSVKGPESKAPELRISKLKYLENKQGQSSPRDDD